MPKGHSAACPCCEPRKPESSTNAASPEGIKRVKDQPVDWNRQFKEKNKSGDGMEETHSIRFLMFLQKPCVQRRVADQAENQNRSSRREPRPLRPTLVRAPQSPACQGSARHEKKKARHPRNVRLRCHPRTSLFDDFQRYASYQKLCAGLAFAPRGFSYDGVDAARISGGRCWRSLANSRRHL